MSYITLDAQIQHSILRDSRPTAAEADAAHRALAEVQVGIIHRQLLEESSKGIVEIADKIGAEAVKSRTDETYTIHHRQPGTPRSVNVVPSIDPDHVFVEFVTARGYYGIHEETISATPADAAAAIQSFLTDGTI